MSPNVEWIALFSVFVIGLSEALDCISCEWSAKNMTSVIHPCLEAPYKENAITCESSSGSARPVCSTKVMFKWDNNQMSLEGLERTCGSKHSLCNNECAKNTATCWLCCDDTDRCNGFPVRTSVVTTTSGAEQITPRVIGQVLLMFVIIGIYGFNDLLRN